MSQQSLAKEKTFKTVLSIILAVICILYMLPIGTLIINTFKGSTYVKSETFALPNAQSFVGWDNYVKGMTFGNYDFWKTVLYSFTITICTFLSLTNGFKLFDQNLALTNGLPKPFVNGVPVGQTEMIALNIYNTFYVGNTSARGTAQAKAVLFFILVAGLGLIQLSTTRRREVQQ